MSGVSVYKLGVSCNELCQGLCWVSSAITMPSGFMAKDVVIS